MLAKCRGKFPRASFIPHACSPGVIHSKLLMVSPLGKMPSKAGVARATCKGVLPLLSRVVNPLGWLRMSATRISMLTSLYTAQWRGNRPDLSRTLENKGKSLDGFRDWRVRVLDDVSM
mmetsp:Transcript_2523/g.3516  ORF Transcript_2523/g.3516 Transcript_2523/m.3516 type:complete len:118 (+) Transcript_2523:5847-6200(+)